MSRRHSNRVETPSTAETVVSFLSYAAALAAPVVSFIIML